MTAQSSPNRPRKEIDGRTFAAKRRAALIRNFVDALGGDDNVTPLQLVDVRRASELTALAEEARTRALRDGSAAVDMSSLVRLEGMASRAQKALGLGIGGKQATEPVADLQAYLASKTAGGGP
jgi:hypothetical protein